MTTTPKTDPTEDLARLHIYDLHSISQFDGWGYISPVIYPRIGIERLAAAGVIQVRKEEGSQWRRQARITAKGRAWLGIV